MNGVVVKFFVFPLFIYLKASPRCYYLQSANKSGGKTTMVERKKNNNKETNQNKYIQTARSSQIHSTLIS